MYSVLEANPICAESLQTIASSQEIVGRLNGDNLAVLPEALVTSSRMVRLEDGEHRAT